MTGYDTIRVSQDWSRKDILGYIDQQRNDGEVESADVIEGLLAALDALKADQRDGVWLSRDLAEAVRTVVLAFGGGPTELLRLLDERMKP